MSYFEFKLYMTLMEKTCPTYNQIILQIALVSICVLKVIMDFARAQTHIATLFVSGWRITDLEKE